MLAVAVGFRAEPTAQLESDDVPLDEKFEMLRRLCWVSVNRISHESLGKGSPGNPIRPMGDYWGLLGLMRAYWEDLAPLFML